MVFNEIKDEIREKLLSTTNIAHFFQIIIINDIDFNIWRNDIEIRKHYEKFKEKWNIETKNGMCIPYYGRKKK